MAEKVRKLGKAAEKVPKFRLDLPSVLCLVDGFNHLEKYEWKSMGRINYPIYDMEKNPAMFQTTNQTCTEMYWAPKIRVLVGTSHV